MSNGFMSSLFIFTGDDGNTGTLEDNLLRLFTNSSKDWVHSTHKHIAEQFEPMTSDGDGGMDQFINDVELNAKGGQQKKSLLFLQDCAVRYNNMAIEAYDAKKLLQSAQYFENTYSIRSNPSIGMIDTASLFNASFF